MDQYIFIIRRQGFLKEFGLAELCFYQKSGDGSSSSTHNIHSNTESVAKMLVKMHFINIAAIRVQNESQLTNDYGLCATGFS